MRHNYENMIGLSRFLQLLETTKKPVTFFKDHNGIQNLGTGLLPKPAKTSPPQRHSERTDSTMHRILPRTILTKFPLFPSTKDLFLCKNI